MPSLNTHPVADNPTAIKFLDGPVFYAGHSNTTYIHSVPKKPPPGVWCFLGDFTTQPNLSRLVRKKPEEYRGYAAGFFAGETAKGGQGVEFI